MDIMKGQITREFRKNNDCKNENYRKKNLEKIE
jgi:hypothetical protein